MNKDCHYEWSWDKGLYLACTKSGGNNNHGTHKSHDQNKKVSEFNTIAMIESLMLISGAIALVYALD